MKLFCKIMRDEFTSLKLMLSLIATLYPLLELVLNDNYSLYLYSVFCYGVFYSYITLTKTYKYDCTFMLIGAFIWSYEAWCAILTKEEMLYTTTMITFSIISIILLVKKDSKLSINRQTFSSSIRTKI